MAHATTFGLGGCPLRATSGGSVSFISSITPSASCSSAVVGRAVVDPAACALLVEADEEDIGDDVA